MILAMMPITVRFISYSFLSGSSPLVNRVRRTALALARAQVPQPAADLLVVELAALLHDVLDKKYVTQEEAADVHAYFRPFFESVMGNVDLVADGRARLVSELGFRIIQNFINLLRF